MGLARVGCGGDAVGGGRVVGVAAVVGGGAAGLELVAELGRGRLHIAGEAFAGGADAGG